MLAQKTTLYHSIINLQQKHNPPIQHPVSKSQRNKTANVFFSNNDLRFYYQYLFLKVSHVQPTDVIKNKYFVCFCFYLKWNVKRELLNGDRPAMVTRLLFLLFTSYYHLELNGNGWRSQTTMGLLFHYQQLGTVFAKCYTHYLTEKKKKTQKIQRF